MARDRRAYERCRRCETSDAGWAFGCGLRTWHTPRSVAAANNRDTTTLRRKLVLTAMISITEPTFIRYECMGNSLPGPVITMIPLGDVYGAKTADLFLD